MKKALAVVATIILLFQVPSAEATVLYDWKDLHVNTGDKYIFNVSLPIDDLEYRSGNFRIQFEELEDLWFTSEFPDGRIYHDRWLPTPFEFHCSYYLFGALSEDKRKIEALIGYVPEFKVYFNGFDYFDGTLDAGVRATANSMSGTIDVGICFGFDDPTMPWNFYHAGEWVVREDTVPDPVPEPGTFALLGVGVLGVLMARRTTPLTLQPSE